MTNKKNKQRKKRMKKQLVKRIKQTAVTSMTFREIEDLRIKEQTDLHSAKENERLERTAPYQEALNKKYGGSVTVKDKYINPRATLLHRCSRCLKEFYANPVWILTREDQKHVCGVDPVRLGDITFKAKRKVTDTDIAKMQKLERQGMSLSKIAVEIGVSRPTIIKYLKKAKESGAVV
ncbi:helix-turn-helix domain-containing protein [Bacillus cereus group sp. MYBK74-2]|uniref:helix-turn-helix domain-containing protein n=1 Tax=Bacillus cereus group sp. MYBK74-2 TaxID=3450609 RepID=UPI003F796EDD